MANWAEKAKDYISQEKLNYELKIKAEQKEYYDGVIVGFRTLDELGVEQMLIEIRDQVWGYGEVTKIPSINSINKTLRGIKELQHKNLPIPNPQYVLTTTSIDYFRAVEDTSDDRGFSSRDFDSYGPKKHVLAIYLIRDKIGIYKADYATDNNKYDHKSFYKGWGKENILQEINITGQPQEIIKKRLDHLLTIDCAQRRNYANQVDPEILKRKDLYRSYKERFNQ